MFLLVQIVQAMIKDRYGDALGAFGAPFDDKVIMVTAGFFGKVTNIGKHFWRPILIRYSFFSLRALEACTVQRSMSRFFV